MDRRNQYRFSHEWLVRGPIEETFAAVADVKTYADWWTPCFLALEVEGPVGPDRTVRMRVRGRLPYVLQLCSRIAVYQPPTRLEIDLDGDLEGRGAWTFTEAPEGTRLKFDWAVSARKKLLRALSPIFKPLFEANHNWVVARAQAGLEPYVQARRAARAAATGEPLRAVATS